MARSPGIPDDIQQFLRDCITSASQLEVLFLLAERNQETWTAEEVSGALRSSPEMADQALSILEDNGLLAIATGKANEVKHGDKVPLVPAYRYTPKDSSLAATVSTLSRLYRERRFAILEFIYAQPDPNSDLHAFSDAFRIRRREGDD